MTSGTRSRWLVVCAMAFAVVAGACGDDSGGKATADAAVDGLGGFGGGAGSSAGGSGGRSDAGQDGPDGTGDGGLGDGGGDAAAALVSLTITPAAPTLAKGTQSELTATAIYADNSTRNVTAEVMWASASAAVATVNVGVVTGVAEGMTVVTASLAGQMGSTNVTVTPAVLASLVLEPASASLPVGRTGTLTATGVFSDGSAQNLTTQVTWTSSAEAVASVSPAGVAKALTVGTTDVTATFGGKMASTSLTVTGAVLNTITLTPATASMAAGTAATFVATGVFSDNSSKDVSAEVVWTSSDAAKATVSNIDGSRGLVQAKAPGAVTITAALAGVMGTASLTVTSATLQTLTIDPAAPRAVRGTSVQFAATGTFSDASTQDLTTDATWAASAPTVATVSNAEGSEGLATALSVGSTQVTATVLGVSASVTLTVTAAALVSIAVEPAATTVARYSQIPMRAIGTFADATTQDLTAQAAWTSSDAAVVTVSNASHSRGTATAVAAGTATITATYQGVAGTAAVTVTDAAVTSISVTPATPSIVEGNQVRFTATATFSDATTQDVTAQVTWASSAHGVVVVSNAANKRGLATARSAGTADVTATLAGVTGTTTATVVQATLMSIAVTPADQTVAAGSTIMYKAIGTYSGGATADVTSQVSWDTGSKAVATASNAPKWKGRVTAVGAGTTMIRATRGQVSGATNLTVAQP